MAPQWFSRAVSRTIREYGPTLDPRRAAGPLAVGSPDAVEYEIEYSGSEGQPLPPAQPTFFDRIARALGVEPWQVVALAAVGVVALVKR